MNMRWNKGARRHRRRRVLMFCRSQKRKLDCGRCRVAQRGPTVDCLEHDVALDGAGEATRDMPRAAAWEVARPSGRGCAAPKCLPRWCASSLVELASVETLDALNPFEWAYEYRCNMSRVLWTGD